MDKSKVCKLPLKEDNTNKITHNHTTKANSSINMKGVVGGSLAIKNIIKNKKKMVKG